MKPRFFWIVFACILMLSAAASAETAYVDGKTANRVHLRDAASQESESMGLFYTGTEVELLYNATLQDEWVRVNIGSMTGYIMNDYLQTEHPQSSMSVCRVKSSSLNLRAEPSKQAKVLHVLKKLHLVGFFYVLYHIVDQYDVEQVFLRTDDFHER